MERVYNLDIENKKRIEQIIGSSYNDKQKKKELNDITGGYLRDYCLEKKKKVTFKNGTSVNIGSIRRWMHVEEFTDLILYNNVVFHKDEENPTHLDLLDYCFEKNYIRVENLSHYSRRDLNTILNYVDPVTKVKGIKDIDLFLGDIEYLFSCPPTAFNLRNYCILRLGGKIPREDFYKSLESPEYYERLLGFTPIERKMQTYVHIHAAGRGFYDTDEEYFSYWDFLDKLEYQIH